MALDNYTDLQAVIADWMNRTDLAARIPDFITLAETVIKRDLKRITIDATIQISTEFTQLPADCAELRSLVLSTGNPMLDKPVTVGTVEQLSYERARWNNVASRPLRAAVYNGAVRVAPTPDQSYTAIITYYQTLLALSASNQTNPTLTESPDLYLFGALMQAAPFLRDDDRVPMWKAKYDEAILKINAFVDREEFGASIKQVRLPRVF